MCALHCSFTYHYQLAPGVAHSRTQLRMRFFYGPLMTFLGTLNFLQKKVHILYVSYFCFQNIVGRSQFRVAHNPESSELPKMTSSNTKHLTFSCGFYIGASV